MLGDCEGCNKKATIFLTQIVDGTVKKVNLCDSCPMKKSIEDPTGFALAETLSKDEESSEPVSDDACPACGFTAEGFRRIGRLGCSECYETFSEQISPVVQSLHRRLDHIGKVPSNIEAQNVFSQKHRQLEKDLEKAIKEEQYEEAARIRDQMRSLDTEDS